MHPGHRGGNSARNVGKQSFGRNRLSPNRLRLKPQSWHARARIESRIRKHGVAKTRIRARFQARRRSVRLKCSVSRRLAPRNLAAKTVRASGHSAASLKRSPDTNRRLDVRSFDVHFFLPFPGSPAGFSCVRSRKVPRIPAARLTLDSPNLSRRRSAAANAFFQRSWRLSSSKLI
jgi:hypothetical protein